MLHVYARIITNTCVYVLHVYARIITNTYIYVHIRSVGVPSRVSVSARIHWKYIHIRLQSTQHTAPLKSNTCIYVRIRAYTYVYVCDTSCTYTIRSETYVVRILHVFARIIESIRSHTAVRMFIYTYAHTCIYVLSGSLMKALFSGHAITQTSRPVAILRGPAQSTTVVVGVG